MAKIHNQLTIKIGYNVQWCNYMELVNACKELNGAALKLFIYLCSLEPGKEFDFFPKIFCDSFNVSLSSEKNAFKELLLHGFLIQQTEDYFLFLSNKN